MEYAIITPTYSGHFHFIKKYLKSFDKFLIDRKCPLCFIIEKQEYESFKKIIGKYKNKLNINVFFLEDIFEKYGIAESPKEILSTYGRLSFQTIKKFYGGLYSEAEKFLFLDSESMLIKPTNIKEIFVNYFKKPKFFLSSLEDRFPEYEKSFVHNYTKVASNILGIEAKYFTVELYEWFYERRILEDLINDLGEPMDIIKQGIPTGKFPDLEGVLEALLYYLYIFKNNEKYKYETYIVQDLFKKYLGENYNSFIKNFNSSNLNVTGIFESCTFFIKDDNVNSFIRFFNDFDIRVTRFKNTNKNYSMQKELIKNSQISIHASELNIPWGIDFNPVSDFFFSNRLEKLYKKIYKILNRKG